MLTASHASRLAGYICALPPCSSSALCSWACRNGPPPPCCRNGSSAQQASGRTWAGGYLALLLVDPYVAVRRLAEKSLETLPGFESFDFDFVAADALPQKQREAVVRWQKLVAGAPDRSGPHLLLDAQGSLDRAAFTELLSERDARPFRIAE